jgi:glycosyltransferase involved in cell wall biosynthesis
MIGIFLFASDLIDLGKINYSLNFIRLFDNSNDCKKVKILVDKKYISKISNYIKYLEIIPMNINLKYRIMRRLHKNIDIDSSSNLNKLIQSNNIGYGIFPSPSIDICHLNIPYATSIQSMGHRLNPELAETTNEDNWHSREKIYTLNAQNADVLFIDSFAGKSYLDIFYKPKSKIYVIPHSLKGRILDTIDLIKQQNILKKFMIKKPYLFYPSQLWPHKNHIRILDAVRLLKEDGINIHIIFTGGNSIISKKYNTGLILKHLTSIYDLTENIIYTGFLNDEEISTLYINAEALIMPQLIPEPCVPFSEAMLHGCPIVGSNIKGMSEQIANAGILVDPYNIISICDGIKKILNRNLRDKLVSEGYNRINELRNISDESYKKFKAHIFSLIN